MFASGLIHLQQERFSSASSSLFRVSPAFISPPSFPAPIFLAHFRSPPRQCHCRDAVLPAPWGHRAASGVTGGGSAWETRPARPGPAQPIPAQPSPFQPGPAPPSPPQPAACAHAPLQGVGSPNMAARPLSRWRLRHPKMAVRPLSRWRQGHAPRGRGTLSRWRQSHSQDGACPEDTKWRGAGPPRLRTCLFSRLRVTPPPRLLRGLARRFPAWGHGTGVGGAGSGRAASGSGGAASVAVEARLTDARAPDVARRHGGCGGAAAGPGLTLRGLPPPPRAPAASPRSRAARSARPARSAPARRGDGVGAARRRVPPLEAAHRGGAAAAGPAAAPGVRGDHRPV